MSTTQKRMVMGLALFLISALACGGWFWWQNKNQPPLPPVQTLPKVPAVSKQKESKSKPLSTKELKDLEARELADLIVPSAGNVAKTSQLQAQIKEEELTLKLDELKAKRQQLKSSAPVVPVAAPQANTLPELPVQNLPSMPVVPRPSRQNVAVVSVQGVNNRMSATIRTGSGNVTTVHVGTNFGGGKVTHISRQGVTLRRGNKSTVLPFDE